MGSATRAADTVVRRCTGASTGVLGRYRIFAGRGLLDRRIQPGQVAHPGKFIAIRHARDMATSMRWEIFPSDLDATVYFYVTVLGFAVARDERDSGLPYVSLVRDAAQVGAAQRPKVDETSRRPPVGVELVLEVDDLDDVHARVQGAGWPIEEQLQQRPWGLRDFRVLDPHGYYLRLTER